MGNFFHGWRRKLGCVTLVVALVLMGGWVRSQTVSDRFCSPTSHDPNTKRHIGVYLISDQSCLTVQRYWVGGMGWTRKAWKWEQNRNTVWDSLPDYDWKWQLWGFQVADDQAVELPYYRFAVLAIPYWSIVLPLTAISAWLLLSKPRKPATKTPEPVEAIGA